MWSMLAFEPGMRRSWRTARPSAARAFSRAPRRSSPTAPRSQALVGCLSSERATATPANRPHFSRSFSSSFALRRSYSRRADDPDTPGSVDNDSSQGGSRSGGHGFRSLGGAFQAADGLRLALIDRFCPGRKRGTAQPTLSGVPEPHMLHEDALWFTGTDPVGLLSRRLGRGCALSWLNPYPRQELFAVCRT
jgi:hypothetical protein